MNQSKCIYWSFILFGLCLQSCEADISLKLQNERRQSRRDYIPPASKPNIIVKEEVYQVQEQIQPIKQFSHSRHHHHQGISNSNSDSSRYQIFEVHNHYEAPTLPINSAQHATKVAEYLPPPVAHKEELHIHATSSTNTNSPSSFDDDNLDVSYLAYGSSKFEPHAPQHASPQDNIHQHQQTYQAPKYLPPHVSTQKAQALPTKPNYMAPAYLPPPGQHHGVQQHQQHQQHQHHQLNQQHHQQPNLPHQQLQQSQQYQHFAPAAKQPLTPLSYAGPSYLPPAHGQEQQKHEETHGHAQQGHIESHAPLQEQNHHQYRAPGYLPPGYDFANPQEHTQQQQPVQHEQQHIPGHLPSGYDFNNPMEHHQQQQEQHEIQEVPNVPEYLPPSYNMESPQQTTQYVSHDTEPTAVTGNELPDGYDFTKPENAEEAIAELHSLQTQTMLLNQQRSQTPVAHGGSTNSVHVTSVQTTHQQQEQQLQPYRGAPYLPPSSTTLHSLSDGHRQQLEQHHEHHQTAIHQMVSYAPIQSHYVPQKKLQNLMPDDVFSAPVQPKVRTIQIIKPNAIKTLKVLETLSDDGVKTIKILGPSQGQPTGIPQQVVNVISQQASHDISQVIKVYNDEHQESVVAKQQQLTSGYLPPGINSKRNLARQTYKRRFHHHH